MEMTKNVRVRFAPSPTGPLHIGGVRTALFNYLFAKKHNGTFILRIEDTDQNRYVEGAETYIVEALNWCGIPFDEGPGKNEKFGPYRQSERKYKQYADELIAKGKAYYAFDTDEELDGHRDNHKAEGKTFIYNWHNRLKLKNSLSLSKEEVEKRLASGEDHVVRFLSPQDETLHLTDIIRGEITIDTNILDDKVLFKSDGMPTYHLANIVDDHLMEITHVIRGEEWLPSLALHYQLYEAFGWKAPQFAHLPLILKPDPNTYLNKNSIYTFANIYSEEFIEKNDFDPHESKKIITSILENYKNLSQQLKVNESKDSKIKKEIKEFLKKGFNGKLSKRDGDKLGFPVFPLEWENPETGETSRGYREDGYFPEAVINFLAFLGWNPGTEQELFSLDELIEAFELERVNKAGARFDPEKTKWYNHQYLQKKSNKELAKLFISEFSQDNDDRLDYLSIKKLDDPFEKHFESFELEYVIKAIKLIKGFGLIKERATFIKDLWDLSFYLFVAPKKYSEKDLVKIKNPEAEILLYDLIRCLKEINYRDFKKENIQQKIEGFINQRSLNLGQIMQPLRIALVGSLQGPDIYKIMSMIKKNETIRRIEKAISL